MKVVQRPAFLRCEIDFAYGHREFEGDLCEREARVAAKVTSLGREQDDFNHHL